MKITKQDYDRIIKNYEEALQKHEESFSLLKSNIFKECPRLEEIEDRIRDLYLIMVKSIANKSKRDECKNEINTLKEEKNSLLSSLGYELNILEKQYACTKCNDTGYINNVTCDCLKKYFVAYAYENSNLKKVFEKENFSTFDMSFYSDTKSPDDKLSPKENMTHIKKACMEFCKNFVPGNSLYFYGTAGLGKTFMCNSVAKELLDSGHSVIYYTAFDLFKALNDETFSKNNANDCSSSVMDKILNCDLLILDDFGTEFITSLSTAAAFNIINSRIVDNKSTVISSNLSLQNIRDTYSERVASRIAGTYQVFKFIGRDIRIQSKYNKNS